ncbi:MAG: hypothetical protein IJH37_05315 [Clostridia bacterium]|nr:hypothetical protein [Clostridia bacterium]
MKVILSNGKELEAKGVHGRSINYQGVQRDSLIFLFDAESESLTDALEDFTAENCAAVTLEGDNGERFIYEHYTIRTELGYGYKDFVLTGGVSGKDDSKVVYVRMAQTTLLERTVESQQEAIDNLIAAVLEG